MVDFHLPSLSAIAIELVALPAVLGFLKKFRRAAVLTDKVWLKRISEFEGRLFTDTEIKAFSREQRTEAQAWLAAD